MIIQSLPRRKRHFHKVQQLDEHTSSAPSLEDLVVESLQNIEQEWDYLSLSPTEERISLFPSESGHRPPHIPPYSSRTQKDKPLSLPQIPIMVAARGPRITVIGIGGGGSIAIMRPPWFPQDEVAILGVHHDLPKNLEKFLPKKYSNNKEETPENLM